MTFYEKVGQKQDSTFYKSRAKVGILLLKSRDSRIIFLRLYRQIRKKSILSGGSDGKNGNFNTI